MSDPLEDEPTPDPPAVAEDDWRRLPQRLMVVRAIPSVLVLVPIGLAFAVFGQMPGSGALFGVMGAVLFGLVRDLMRVYSTRVRVTAERIELRTGVFTTSHRSLRRDRVRTVDVTGPVLHRVARLAVLRIGTGEQSRGEDTGDLELDALDEQVARELQHELLPSSVGGELDRVSALQWRWLPWSIPSWWTLALPAIMVGALAQLANAIGVDAAVDEQDARALVDDATAIGAAVLVAVAAAAFLAIGVLARCATFVETWWSFELHRDRAAGLLRSNRGLLTTRTTSLQLARIRGVQLREPLLLRAWHVATARVVTTGLADRGSSAERGGSTSLGPAARHSEVESIAADVLDQARSPTAGALRAHPPAARSRRVVRALLASALFGTVALVATDRGALAWVWAGMVTVIAATIGVAIALDLARSLGHARHERWLVVRSGSLTRSTTALEVDGIIGWIGRRTIFQRRAGLVTLVAATAAGDGAYAAIDAGEADAVDLALRCTPELLTPFVMRAPRCE